MIYVVAGDMGSGKTLKVLEWMEMAVASGRPVYTNIQLLPACPFYDRVARIDTEEYPVVRGDPTLGRGIPNPDYRAFWHYVVEGSFVVIDEADIYFDCTDHSEFGKDVRQFHKMARKLGLDLVYIVQNIPNLYVRIRRLASRFVVAEWTYRTSRIFRMLDAVIGEERSKALSRFRYAEFGDDRLMQLRGDGYFKYGEASRFFGWYETRQLLGDTSFLRAKILEDARREKVADDLARRVVEAEGAERRVEGRASADLEPAAA